jgi:hypothetical protein
MPIFLILSSGTVRAIKAFSYQLSAVSFFAAADARLSFLILICPSHHFPLPPTAPVS